MIAAGFLQGLANGKNASNDRKMRQREIGVMEALAKGGGPAAGSAPAGMPPGGGHEVVGTPILDRASYAVDYLTGKGVPEIAASGVVGNLMQESGEELNAGAVGDNGNSFGAAQWNGPRRDAYFAYADGRGSARDNLDTQLDYLLEEGRTTEKRAWDAILAAKTPEDAALIGSQKFWRPGDPRNENRTAYASRVYAGRGKAVAAEAEKPAPEAKSRWAFFDRFVGDE